MQRASRLISYRALYYIEYSDLSNQEVRDCFVVTLLAKAVLFYVIAKRKWGVGMVMVEALWQSYREHAIEQKCVRFLRPDCIVTLNDIYFLSL
jgi:hypothetical protein